MKKLKFFSDTVYYCWTTIFGILAACYWPHCDFLAIALNVVYIIWMIDGFWFAAESFFHSKRGSYERRLFWMYDIDEFLLPFTLWVICILPLYLGMHDIWYF